MRPIITVTSFQSIDLSWPKSHSLDRVLLMSCSHCCRLLTGGELNPQPTKLVLSRQVSSPMQIMSLTTPIWHFIYTSPVTPVLPPLTESISARAFTADQARLSGRAAYACDERSSDPHWWESL